MNSAKPTLPANGIWCIRLVNGPTTWSTWPIGPRPTHIGRGLGCAIRLEDARVSRLQCEITAENGAPRLIHRSQRNPTLVNGFPCTDTTLRLGDVIAIAGYRLIVDYHSSDSMRQGSGMLWNPGDTTLRGGQVRYRTEVMQDLPVHELPVYSSDLLSLHTATRAFVRLRSLDELISEIRLHLAERFRPARAWVVWCIGAEGSLAPYPAVSPEEERELPHALLHQTCTEGIAIARPECRAMCAPLLHGEKVFGAILVSLPDSENLFSDNDLHYLMALAECVAPIIRAAEQYLHMERNPMEPPDALLARLVGESEHVQHLRHQCSNLAHLTTPVLIQGESGVGKELLARLLHDLGPRSSGPFISVNCAGHSDEQFESDMFGKEAGSPAETCAAQKGYFEQAHGGTLFLDDVGELSATNQARLLSAVDSGRIRRVGGTGDIALNVRILSASSRTLLGTEQFRPDLYHRLAGALLYILPLRERINDILPLALHFARAVLRPGDAPKARFGAAAIVQMQGYAWPGNARELRNLVERAAIAASEGFMAQLDLPMQSVGAPGTTPQVQSIELVEREHLIKVMRLNSGNVASAAASLSIPVSTLYYKLRRHGLKAQDFSGG